MQHYKSIHLILPPPLQSGERTLRKEKSFSRLKFQLLDAKARVSLCRVSELFNLPGKCGDVESLMGFEKVLFGEGTKAGKAF